MIVLRPDQAAILASVRDILEHDGASLLLVSPTGSGKTVIFCALAKDFHDKGLRVLILAHRVELIDQISRTLTNMEVDHGCIAPSRKKEHGKPVQVASVNTLVRDTGRIYRPDLIIIDEAHHAIARSSFGRIVESFRGVPVLGVTATPERLSGEGLGETFSTMLEGPSTKTLIDMGHLSKFRIFAPPQHATDQVKTRMGDFDRNDLGLAMNRPSITGDAVEHYRRLGLCRRALVFCVTVQHARDCAESFSRAGYSAQSIDGTMDRTTRKGILDGFASGRVQVLTSCDLASEGLDIPAIEVAILLRPTKSLCVYLQQVGRALRPYPGKEYALILDHAGNTVVHGWPDDERNWSLEGRKRRTRQDGEKSLNVRVCGQCWAASKAPIATCPYCQYAWPPQPRDVKEVDGELQEAIRKERSQARKIEQGSARGLTDLIALARGRGYQRPEYWARCVWGARQGRGR